MSETPNADQKLPRATGNPGEKRKCVIVLGMHRSGTSMVAGLLHGAGVKFGGELLPGNSSNEKGYFESQRLYYINEGALKVSGTSWDDVNLLPDSWLAEPALEPLKVALRKALAEEYEGSPVFGVKDPRLATLLPMYLEALAELDVEPCFVVVERKTIEVHESLAARDGFTYEKTVALAEKHRALIERHTESAERKISVRFDDVLRDPRNFLRNVGLVLGIDLPFSGEAGRRAAEFAEARLKHHTVSYDELVLAARRELALSDGEARALGEEIERKDAEAARLAAEMQAAASEAARALASRDSEIQRKDAEVARVTTEIQNKDAEVARLAAESRQLDLELRTEKKERQRVVAALGAIENSLTWRLNRRFAALFHGGGFLGRRLAEAERATAAFLNRLFPARQASGQLAAGRAYVLDEAAVTERARAGSYPNADRYYDEADPEVSVVILNFNKSLLAMNCLHAVWSHAAGRTYEIILVDNGSDSGELRRLENFGGRFRLLKLGTNRFFGEANNIAAEQARGKYLVFLNNDAFVKENWLAPLIRCLEEAPEAGVAGSKLIYPDGRLQEAGAMLAADGTALQIGKGGDPNAPEFSERKEVDYCSASSAAVRKDVFERALGFDLVWEPVYYEDTDLCLKIKSLGLKTYYCPDSEVVHIESATSSSVKREMGLHNIVEVNRQKFERRWLSGNRFEFQVDGPEAAFAPRADRENVVLYSPYRIMMGGGERYLLTMASVLGDRYNVYVMSEHPYSRMRFRNLFREMGLPFRGIGLVTADRIAEVGKVDTFFCMGNEVLPPHEPIGRKNFFMCQFPFSVENRPGIFLERRPWLSGYDGVIVNSEYTARHYRAQLARYSLPAVEVSVVPPPVELSPDGTAVGEKPGMIVSVGRFFGGAYTKGHRHMVRAFKKMVDAGDVVAELHLVGALHPERAHREYYVECRKSAEGYPIFFHADAPSSKLRELYAEASLYWHVTGIDADEETHPENMEHFGISLVEAMSHGCVPVVLGRGGPLEIVDHGESGHHIFSAEELAAVSRALILDGDPETLGAMRVAAVKKSKSYSRAAFAKNILALTERRA